MFKQYKRPLKFIFDSFKGHTKLFYIFLSGKVIEGIFYVGLPILAKMEMDQLVEKNEQLFGIIELSSFNIFLVILCIIFLVQLVETLVKSFIDLFQYDYIKMYGNFFLKSMYHRLSHIQPGILLNSRNQRFIRESISSSYEIENAIRNFIGGIITNSFVIVGIFTVLSFLNIWIFLVLILSSVIMYLLEKAREKLSEQQNFEEKYEYEDKINRCSFQLGDNFPQLISTGGFPQIVEKYNLYNEKLREKIKERQKGDISLSLFSFITENISEILIKLIVGWSIFFAGASVGTMTMVIMYVGRMNEVFDFCRQFKFQFNRFSDQLKKLDIFLELSKNIQKKTKNIENFSTISFKNVGFSYPNFAKYEMQYLQITEERIKSYSSKDNYDKDKLHMIEETKKELKKAPPIILNDISLTFEKGKTYGLVGKNGAGKTTIISLLQNFFDDFSGNISIDEQEITPLSRTFFEKNISVINQVPYIMNGFTIRENLLLGSTKSYSDEHIFGLLEKFGLAKKVKKLRKGLDSEIGYDNDFSGGEKQLLVLIRIILQDKPILIMDEGTNQLDAENEIKVMDELLKNKAGKIVIFITHRMTTIKKTDKIYCLQDGKIQASGTHKELIGKDNVYNDFWNKQVGE